MDRAIRENGHCEDLRRSLASSSRDLTWKNGITTKHAYHFLWHIRRSMPTTADAKAGRVAFTHPDFVLFHIALFLIVGAVEMPAVAVGWQVYDITKRALDLGLVGLAQFLPGILLFLVSGHASDRFDRRKVLAACYAGYAVCSGLLLVLALRSAHPVLPIYLVLILLGVVRSFNGTASRSILPQLVPDEHFANA